MTFIPWLLIHISTIPLCAILTLLCIVCSFACLAVVRRFVPLKVLKSHHDMMGAIFGALAMAYTVLIAFVVVISWQNYDRTATYVQDEANALVDLHRLSGGLDSGFQADIRPLLEKYGKMVTNEEWPLLSRGLESDETRLVLRNIWAVYESYEPVSEREKVLYAESISKIDQVRENRRLRIISAQASVHPVLWFILIIGAVATIGFSLFFGADNFIAHGFMTSMLAIVIVLILVLILLFDYPFTGSASLGPETFSGLLSFS